MLVGVADTHTVLWYLFNDPRLSTVAGDFIDQAAAKGQRVGVSSITLAEIVYLVDQRRVPANAYIEVKAALMIPNMSFKKCR